LEGLFLRDGSGCVAMDTRREETCGGLMAKWFYDFDAHGKGTNVRHHRVFDGSVVVDQRGLDSGAHCHDFMLPRLHLEQT